MPITVKHFYLLMICFVLHKNVEATVNASVTFDPSTGLYHIHENIKSDSVAWATFTDEIFKTGWSYLQVWTNGTYDDTMQVYAAGLVEGYLTRSLIKNHWRNTVADYCNGEIEYCYRLREFLQTNLNYMTDNISLYRTTRSYWHQAGLILEQISGIEDGYMNAPTQPRTKLDVVGIMFSNICGDLEDLEVVLKKTRPRRKLGEGSCSALIKLLDGNKDIYVAHDTWTAYNTMLRVLKKYNLQIHVSPQKGSPLVPGHTVSFSSSPGMIFSGDDFYVISSGLVTIETTIGNDNSTLWKYVQPEGTVLEWIRNLVANRMSKTGAEWVSWFKKFNSGTYNNQWMIVDYKRFKPGKEISPGLLWVLEQLPGHVVSGDVTKVLLKNGYWASYNTAYFPDIFNMSGSAEMVKKFGDWFSYDRTPRALIFKRDQGNVHDIDSMTRLMRYNNFTKDPLSRCNCTPPYSAENAIAARCDLNPKNGSYPFSALGHRSHGATDMKLTTFGLSQKFEFVAIGGPTHDPLPPFQWSKSDFSKDLPHHGHPDLWVFKPVTHHWK
ncbi:putative phospholipase B-like 2 [Limulus polyphemus]|uniref:Phospholipase B-like n=1 Tax=Limulus polyphemus TaxID=6850 RepID=A0ABM1BXW6_LIMPO|nr:putative phospholipase B-like 2 [Limulus polyphemus]XP_013790771.1 putative phospholipase B-like 2 [Limulus polyphemus]XP_022258646.1 putative phospholipase B-like 2 [Limulus polyphemus]XP_022258647.1 putative phospholipase B-like 2 [Limulus polyphemus]